MNLKSFHVKRLAVAVLVSTSVGGSAIGAQIIVPYTADATTVALYHLDETTGNTAFDSSGNGYNATYGSSVSKGNASVPGLSTSVKTAANLANGRITAVDAANVDGRNSSLYTTALGNFTIEAWVRLTDLNFSGYANIFTVQPTLDANSDFSFKLIGPDIGSHDLALSFGAYGNGYNATFTIGALSWDVNQWYHVAVTGSYDGTNTTIKLYRNVMDDSNTPSPATPVFGTTIVGQLRLNSANSATRQLEIGNFYGGAGNYEFPGFIDEVRFSNVAKTEFNLTSVVIPEPSSTAMILLGIFGMVNCSRILSARRASKGTRTGTSKSPNPGRVG